MSSVSRLYWVQFSAPKGGLRPIILRIKPLLYKAHSKSFNIDHIIIHKTQKVYSVYT